MPKLRAILHPLDDTQVLCGQKGCREKAVRLARIHTGSEVSIIRPGLSATRNSPNGETWRTVELYYECKRDGALSSRYGLECYRFSRYAMSAMRQGEDPRPRRTYDAPNRLHVPPRDAIRGYPAIIECWKCHAPNLIGAQTLRVNAGGVRVDPRKVHSHLFGK